LYPNPYQPNRATFNRQQLAALALEHDVRVISPILWVEELAATFRQGFRLARNRRATCDGIRIEHPRYFYTPKCLRRFYGEFYKCSIYSSFKRILREFAPDVIFASWAYPDGWAAVELGHRSGLPVVIKVHGCDVAWGLERNPARLRKTIDALRRA